MRPILGLELVASGLMRSLEILKVVAAALSELDLRPDYSKQQAAKQSVGWMMPP
jgi:hypothetical protein